MKIGNKIFWAYIERKSAPKYAGEGEITEIQYSVVFPYIKYSQENWSFKISKFASLGNGWKTTRHEMKLFKWYCINLQLTKVKKQTVKHTWSLKKGGARTIPLYQCLCTCWWNRRLLILSIQKWMYITVSKVNAGWLQC